MMRDFSDKCMTEPTQIIAKLLLSAEFLVLCHWGAVFDVCTAQLHEGRRPLFDGVFLTFLCVTALVTILNYEGHTYLTYEVEK